MNKEICFFIDGNALFLDKVLVSFNDAPIFFVCCDDSQNYYIALCINMETLEYIIVQCSLQMLYQMLVKKIEMREPFVAANHFWKVTAGASVEEDEVCCLQKASMDLSVLPYQHAFYDAKNKEDVDYVEQIESIYCVKENFSTIETTANLENAINTMMAISLDFASNAAQYFELTPILPQSFIGRTKEFMVPNRETKTFSYTEQIKSGANTSVDQQFIESILSSNTAAAA